MNRYTIYYYNYTTKKRGELIIFADTIMEAREKANVIFKNDTNHLEIAEVILSLIAKNAQR